MVQLIQRLLIAVMFVGAPIAGIACAPKASPEPVRESAPVVQPTMPEAPATSPSTSPPAHGSTATQPTTAGSVEPTTAEAASTAPTTPPVVEDAPPPAVVAPVTPNPALADRFSEVAQDVLRDPSVSEASWLMARSMLEAARRLNPDEPRYARDLIEAQLHFGDTDAAIATLSDYRQLAPEDQAAQVRQIDLFVRRFQTADRALEYLKRLVETPSIPAPVRSAAAVRLYSLRLERAESQEADAALDQALELNPQNLDAIRLRYASLPTTQPAEGAPSPAVRRLELLLAMLSANPVQPVVAEDMARELADAGLVPQALEQYQLAFNLYRATSVLPSQEAAVDYAAQFFLNDDTRSADTLAAQLLEAVPTNTEAWFLRMLLARADNDAARLAALQQQAGIVLGNRVSEILKEAGDASATTQPVTVPPAAGATTNADPLAAPADPLAAPAAPAPTERAALPDPAAALQRVQESNRPELLDAFALAASEIAWFQIFYEQRGDEAKAWIDAFKAARPEFTEIATRLEGWSFFVNGQHGEAQVKLSAVADRDPLAELGLIQLEAQAKDAAAAPALKERASKLLNEHPVSLLGATLYEALKPLGVKVTPGEAGKELQAALEKAPRDTMAILDRPQQFYALRAEPVKSTYMYGEPVLLRIGLQNVGKVPLTIGADGVIRSDLWFDAQFRGAMKDIFNGVAYDQIAGPLVLQPGEGTSQIVKVNQGALRAALESNPSASIQFMASVITNPSSAGAEGQVAAGPAGQRVTMSRLAERTGMPVQQPVARQNLLGAAEQGTPSQKVLALDLIATLIVKLQKEPPAPPAEDAAAPVDSVPQMMSELREGLRKATYDTDENVRAWATFLTGYLSSPEEQAAAVQRLAGGSTWQERLLAGLLVQATRQGQAAIQPLAESDPDEAVRRYVTGLQDRLAAATTQPISAPAVEPGQ